MNEFSFYRWAILNHKEPYSGRAFLKALASEGHSLKSAHGYINMHVSHLYKSWNKELI